MPRHEGRDSFADAIPLLSLDSGSDTESESGDDSDVEHGPTSGMGARERLATWAAIYAYIGRTAQDNGGEMPAHHPISEQERALLDGIFHEAHHHAGLLPDDPSKRGAFAWQVTAESALAELQPDGSFQLALELGNLGLGSKNYRGLLMQASLYGLLGPQDKKEKRNGRYVDISSKEGADEAQMHRVASDYCRSAVATALALDMRPPPIAIRINHITMEPKALYELHHDKPTLFTSVAMQAIREAFPEKGLGSKRLLRTAFVEKSIINMRKRVKRELGDGHWRRHQKEYYQTLGSMMPLPCLTAARDRLMRLDQKERLKRKNRRIIVLLEAVGLCKPEELGVSLGTIDRQVDPVVPQISYNEKAHRFEADGLRLLAVEAEEKFNELYASVGALGALDTENPANADRSRELDGKLNDLVDWFRDRGVNESDLMQEVAHRQPGPAVRAGVQRCDILAPFANRLDAGWTRGTGPGEDTSGPRGPDPRIRR